MDNREYLKHIKIAQTEEASYLFLERLVSQHLIRVPFENLDILHGKEIVLDESHLYEKIVVQRRGGFCYELNGLFSWLLGNLGFTVSMASGRVYIASEDQFTPEFDHMVLLVHLDKTYLVDVGFGDSFRKPILMPEGMIKDISGKYQIQSARSEQGVHLVQKREQDEWCPIYSFTTHPKQMSDFAKMCIYHQTSPDSHFTQRTICTIATEDGRITLSDNTLTITQGGTKKKISVHSPEIFKRMLLEHFGIELENG